MNSCNNDKSVGMMNTPGNVVGARELLDSLPDIPDMDEINRISDIYEDIEFSKTNK